MVTAAQQKAADDKAAADKETAKKAAAKSTSSSSSSSSAGAEVETKPATAGSSSSSYGSGNEQVKAADKGDDEYTTPTAVDQPAVPQHGTVEGPDGVERIVFVGVQDGWEPAPVNATDEDIERAKKREGDEDERREALKEGRVDPVSGQVLDKKAWGERQKELKAQEKANA